MSSATSMAAAETACAPAWAVTPYAMPLSWIGQTARLAARDGVRVGVAMAAVGVTIDEAPEDAAIGTAESMLLCMLLVNAVDDELHGVARRRMSRGTAAMGARAMASAADLETAVGTLARFYDMIGGLCRFDLHCERGEAKVRIVAERGDRDHRALVEELLAHMLHIQFSFYLGELLPLSRLTTSTPRHPALGRRHPHLLCPVVTGNTTELVFPAALLTTRQRGTAVDKPLWDADRFWLARHPATRRPLACDDAERPVSAALLALLTRQDAAVATCATALGLSLADLRHGLSSEGGCFRQIRRDALVERSRPTLAAGGSADDLACALGYSDARSFRRALKLATGLGIAELRREAELPVAANGQVIALLREETLRLE